MSDFEQEKQSIRDLLKNVPAAIERGDLVWLDEVPFEEERFSQRFLRILSNYYPVSKEETHFVQRMGRAVRKPLKNKHANIIDIVAEEERKNADRNDF